MRYFSEFDIRAMRAGGRAILIASVKQGANWLCPAPGGTFLGLLVDHTTNPYAGTQEAVVELPRRVRDLGRNAALRIPDPPADHPCAGGCSCLDVRRSA